MAGRRLSECLYPLSVTQSSGPLLHFSTANRVPTASGGDVGFDRVGKGRPPRVLSPSFPLVPFSTFRFPSGLVRAGTSAMHQPP